MTNEKDRFESYVNNNGQLDIIDHLESEEKNAICIYNDLGVHPFSSAKAVCDKLNEQDSQIKKANQEILACHDTLVTIEALCDAVLNYDFKNVEDKTDFCHMLNEMDNKDLMFFKECFEAIRGNDLKRMTSLTLECYNGDDVND